MSLEFPFVILVMVIPILCIALLLYYRFGRHTLSDHPIWQRPTAQKLLRLFLPPAQENVKGPIGSNLYANQLFERAFSAMLRVISLLSAIGLFFIAIDGQLNSTSLAIYTLGVLGMATLGTARFIPFAYRAYITLAIIYGLALMELSGYGYSIDALLLLLSLTVLATILTGWQGGLLSFIISFATLLLCGWQITQGQYQPWALPQIHSLRPSSTVEIIFVLNIFSANAIALVMMIALLLRSSNMAWRRETEAFALLQQERDALDQRILERTDALQQSEANLRAFSQDMKSLQLIHLQLGLIEDLDTLYQQMVSVSRQELKLDRLGLFLLDETEQQLTGTYGSDETGGLRDERHYQETITADHWTHEILRSPNQVKQWEDSPLYDNGVMVGMGWKVGAALWTGQKALGFLVCDNYITRQPIRPYQTELISLLGGIFGHLLQRKRAALALRQQKQLFENLVDVARATVADPALEQTLYNALETLLRITGAENGNLILLENGQADTVAFVGSSDRFIQDKSFVAHCLTNGLEGWVVRQRQATLLSDTRGDERWLPLDPKNPAGSALCAPIFQGSNVSGVVTLLHSQPNHFTADTLTLLQAAVDQITLALNNAHIYDAQRRMVGQQTALYEVLRAVSGQTSLTSAAKIAVNAISQFTGWPTVQLILQPPDIDQWQIFTASRLSTAQLQPSTQKIVSLALQTDTIQHIANTAQDPDAPPDASGTAGSELAIPLHSGEKSCGVLAIHDNWPNTFGSDDILLAQSFAEILALALESARLFQSIQEQRGRLQAIIESSQDGLVMVGTNQHLLVINEPALRMLHLPGEPNDWLECNIKAVLRALRRSSPQATRAVISQLRQNRAEPQPINAGELQIGRVALRWQSMPVMNGDSLLGWLFSLRDITEERAVENLRADMMNTMVHDLRNPITIMIGALELLIMTESEIPPSQLKLLEMIKQSSHRMMALVNSILDINRLESGQMPVRPEPFSIAQLVAEQCALQQSLAVQNGVNLTYEASDDWPLAWGDPGLIQRVLQNLIGNALKFTPQDGSVSAQVRLVERGQRPFFQITIRDNGPGIGPDIQDTLFDKFTTGRQKGAGSGLGLAFCKLALNAHEQQIWAANESGGGASFIFTLDLAPLPGEASDAIHPNRQNAPGAMKPTYDSMFLD
jgi:signal transduction histidine kinase